MASRRRNIRLHFLLAAVVSAVSACTIDAKGQPEMMFTGHWTGSVDGLELQVDLPEGRCGTVVDGRACGFGTSIFAYPLMHGRYTALRDSGYLWVRGGFDDATASVHLRLQMAATGNVDIDLPDSLTTATLALYARRTGEHQLTGTLSLSQGARLNGPSPLSSDVVGIVLTRSH